MRLESYLILQYTSMHNQIRTHRMTLFTSNRFDASLPYWLEMISDWSLYHLSPPRKLSASRSLTSSSERSSSGRSGQRGWSSPTKAAHWKREREEIVEHIFAKMLNSFIQCLRRNEPTTIQFSYDAMWQFKSLLCSNGVHYVYHLLTFTLHHLRDLKHKL